ncbi:hypothetical protein [Nocardiopsis sp. MG754419]|nr:hypothetical protein [Nocardiopsis sp. MG754419]
MNARPLRCSAVSVAMVNHAVPATTAPRSRARAANSWAVAAATSATRPRS